MNKLLALLIIVSISVSLVPCHADADSDRTATCYNGKFTGTYEENTGVLSFKGIPYAISPVGERRWRAPEAVDASDETFRADSFGKSAIQYRWFSEDITTEVSEDCLTLNIWTKDLRKR